MSARFILVIGLLLLGPMHARAEQTRLRITLQQSIKQHIGQNLLQFKKEVEARSDGAIAVDIYDDSKLYSDNEAVGAVASGAIEMATMPAQQLTKQVPALGIFEQPFLFNSEALVRASVSPDSEMRKLLDHAIIEATGIRVLWWQSYGFSVFFSKARDLTHPSGVRNQKVRVFGDNMGRFVRYCGGAGFLISASKQHQAVKDGTVDMIMSGITTVEPRELWKVTDTVTRTEHAALEWPVIINEKGLAVLGAACPEHRSGGVAKRGAGVARPDGRCRSEGLRLCASQGDEGSQPFPQRRVRMAGLQRRAARRLHERGGRTRLPAHGRLWEIAHPALLQRRPRGHLQPTLSAGEHLPRFSSWQYAASG
jgi:C4-dicarboxylate-binding protein DctP